jgi:Domain of unknown function (DUF4288)
MNWYAAHIVMVVEFKDAVQRRFPVWENIVLIEARSEDEAFDKAESHGRAEEGDDGGSFRWGEQPARWTFAGVRKLTECQAPDQRPANGTELSYTEFELDSREAVKKLVAGKPVEARFNDCYRSDEKGNRRTAEEPKPAKRRPA